MFILLSSHITFIRYRFFFSEISFLWLFFRSSKLWCHPIINLQDCLQTPVCAEEMQPWETFSPLFRRCNTGRSICLNMNADLIDCILSVCHHPPPPPPRSSSGGCLEHDRSLSWQRAQHIGPQCWDQCVTAGDYSVFHLLPAQQATAHHPPDQCGAVHWAPAQLHGGHLWQVWNRCTIQMSTIVYRWCCLDGNLNKQG